MRGNINQHKRAWRRLDYANIDKIIKTAMNGGMADVNKVREKVSAYNIAAANFNRFVRILKRSKKLGLTQHNGRHVFVDHSIFPVSNIE